MRGRCECCPPTGAQLECEVCARRVVRISIDRTTLEDFAAVVLLGVVEVIAVIWMMG